MVNERSAIEENASGLFPFSPRVIYQKNPLLNVTCQLRFPVILRVDSEHPAAFQEQIRSRYPIYREQSLQPMLAIELPAAGTGNLPSVAKRIAHYEFISDDEVWRIGLTRDSLALTTSRYTRWEDFLDHLRLPLAALTEHYNPTFFTRVGLRYQDLIQRSKLGLLDLPWRDLLKPHIAGVLAIPAFADAVASSISQLGIQLQGGKVTLNYGLAEAVQEKEECYLIDSDFYKEGRTELNDTISALAAFNKQSGRLFRSCIEERLHAAMEPLPA